MHVYLIELKVLKSYSSVAFSTYRLTWHAVKIGVEFESFAPEAVNNWHFFFNFFAASGRQVYLDAEEAPSSCVLWWPLGEELLSSRVRPLRHEERSHWPRGKTITSPQFQSGIREAVSFGGNEYRLPTCVPFSICMCEDQKSAPKKKERKMLSLLLALNRRRKNWRRKRIWDTC